MDSQAVAPEVEGMAPTQRFLLDMSGYLRIEAALSAEEVQLATEAVRAADTEGDVDDCWCASREMEQLSCFHPAIWPVVMELTDGKPKLWEGGVLTDDPAQEMGHGAGGTLHCGRDDWGPESATFTATNSGTIRVNDFVVFIYLTDVLEGDESKARLHPGHALMLVWPFSDEEAEFGTRDNDPWDVRALGLYAGSTVIHVGEMDELSHNCTTSKMFKQQLTSAFTQVRCIELPSWPNCSDALTIWKRRSGATAA